MAKDKGNVLDRVGSRLRELLQDLERALAPNQPSRAPAPVPVPVRVPRPTGRPY